MLRLENEYIDYSLFSKYDKEYLKSNLIVPLYEDEFCLYLGVCNTSQLSSVNDKFSKLLKFKEFDTLEIRFILSNLILKIEMFLFARKCLSNESNTIKAFIDKLLSLSVSVRASDIHIECNSNLVLFRFRIDGKLRTFFTFDKILFKSISSYIKLISNLDITQTRLPMDSRFSIIINGASYDFRVSTMPINSEESIVLRILDNKNVNKSISTLGLSSDLLNTLENALKLTQGLILITGPTGSGKTTTLYSILKELNNSEKKIITVEDPIEYKIDSISQIAVNNKIGFSFEVILKNILRQDPDVIFIGEIRDKLSLNIALQASLTGHLVLASIHANNSVETINRLFDLEADPFLVSSTLKYVFSQRLVLLYCKSCSGLGCDKCNYSKYYDRSCIAEILKIDEKISSLIFKKSDLNEMKKHLKDINFKTLLDDGKRKVELNDTSLDEVYKVMTF